jgi:hypothetical protein
MPHDSLVCVHTGLMQQTWQHDVSQHSSIRSMPCHTVLVHARLHYLPLHAQSLTLYPLPFTPYPRLQDFTLVATGTTFPLVFSIQQAFTRREKATTIMANLKASLIALYFMHR